MPRTIMVVDDSASIRQMLAFTLNQAGHQVVKAADGREALRKMDDCPVHLVFTDLNMPGMNGIDLIRRIRSDSRCGAVPIIVLTTGFESAKKAESRSAGATGWMVKPFTPNVLLKLVEKVLS